MSQRGNGGNQCHVAAARLNGIGTQMLAVLHQWRHAASDEGMKWPVYHRAAGAGVENPGKKSNLLLRHVRKGMITENDSAAAARQAFSVPPGHLRIAHLI